MFFSCITWQRACVSLTWSMPTWKAFMAFFDDSFKTSTQNISCDIMIDLENNKNNETWKGSPNSSVAHKLQKWKLTTIEEVRKPTSFPSGKQRQKKSGRGLPTPSLIASVITEVISTEKRRPRKNRTRCLVNAKEPSKSFIRFLPKQHKHYTYRELLDENHRHPS